MRIIVSTALNTGPAEYQNVGDVAMLQVAVTRLAELWPHAQVDVLTDSPQNLAKYCPQAKPLSRPARDVWIREHPFIGKAQRFLPRGLASLLARSTRSLSHRQPKLYAALLGWRISFSRHSKASPRDIDSFASALRETDLFLVCGAGGFADTCPEWTMETLNTIKLFQRQKIPVFIVGQGMGPMTNPALLTRSRAVLPAVDLISLRGSRGGSALLDTLRVPRERVIATGDEAVELAYNQRPQELGSALGVNLRVTGYAEVGADIVRWLRPTLEEFSQGKNTQLLPVPIAFHPSADDHATLRQLLPSFAENASASELLKTPLEVIQQVGRCRVVITGAYHAAVFALSQGVPVVALSGSEYYSSKFLGLQDQFGAGCELVQLDSPDAQANVAAALGKVWDAAGSLRKPLQDLAFRQVQTAREAYHRLPTLISQRAL